MAKPGPYHQKVHPVDVEQNRIKLVDVGSEHVFRLSRFQKHVTIDPEASAHAPRRVTATWITMIDCCSGVSTGRGVTPCAVAWLWRLVPPQDSLLARLDPGQHWPP